MGLGGRDGRRCRLEQARPLRLLMVRRDLEEQQRLRVRVVVELGEQLRLGGRGELGHLGARLVLGALAHRVAARPPPIDVLLLPPLELGDAQLVEILLRFRCDLLHAERKLCAEEHEKKVSMQAAKLLPCAVRRHAVRLKAARGLQHARG